MRHVPAILLVLVAALCAVLARAAEPLTLTERIARVLLAQQRHVSDVDEDPRAREARLREVAASVSSAVQHATCAGAWARPTPCRRIWPGSQLELAAALLALGWHEAYWAGYVGRDECHLGPVGARCDQDPKTGLPRARSYWQLWAVAAPDLHALPLGDPAAIRVAAWAAARHLAGAANFCTNAGEPTDWAGAFGRYGARGCAWRGGIARARTMERLQAALRRARTTPDPNVIPAAASES
jgi:hypothetical protein